MKIRRFSSKKLACFGLPLVLLFMLLSAYQWRQHELYSGKYVINPTTGKYDPALESWVVPITTTSGDSVGITLGDRSGAANSVDQDVLYLLSPVLRTHPQAKTFIVYWNLLCCTDGGNYDGGQELKYERDTGEVSYHSTGFSAGKAYKESKIIASKIDDSKIHEVAGRYGSYEELNQ